MLPGSLSGMFAPSGQDVVAFVFLLAETEGGRKESKQENHLITAVQNVKSYPKLTSFQC